MKKILIAISLFVISSSAFAQISGGLFAGPNLSWFGVDSKMQSNEKVRLGYEFGAWADFPISDNFVFNLGMKYNDLGGTMSYKYGAVIDLYDTNVIDTIAGGSNIKYHLNYLSIPLGFKGKTNEIGFLSYFMKAGVAPMFSLKGKANIDDDSNLISKNIFPVNLSWYMGAGFEWSLSGNTRFVTELVYNGGIMDFVKNKNDEVTVDVFENDGQTSVRDHVGKINSVSLKVGILF